MQSLRNSQVLSVYENILDFCFLLAALNSLFDLYDCEIQSSEDWQMIWFIIKSLTNSALNNSIHQFLTNKSQVNDAEEASDCSGGHFC